MGVIKTSASYVSDQGRFEIILRRAQFPTNIISVLSVMSSGFQPTLSLLCNQSDECGIEDDQLENDPYNYNMHINLVEYLEKLGNLPQLRKARENMHSIFPLSSTLWMKWLEDELLEMDESNEIMNITELFEKALLDQPFSPDLWLKYLKYSSVHLNMSAMKLLFERAIHKAGYNLINGVVIFQFLEEYLLKETTIDQKITKVNEEDKIYFSNLYAIRLKIPHLDATLRAFSDYENFNKLQNLPIDLPITMEHTKILDVYTNIESYLRALSENPIETNFKELLNFFFCDDDAQTCSGNTLFIEALYEMFLSVNEVNANIWKEYIEFVSTSRRQRLNEVYERAIRFIPWDVVIWYNYLQFCSQTDLGAITSKTKIDDRTLEQVMDVFQKATEFFINNYGEQTSYLMFLYELKADYLLVKSGNVIKYIEFMDSLLGIDEKERSNGNIKYFPARMWINYIKQLLTLMLMDKATEVINLSFDRVVGSDLPTLVASCMNFKILCGEQEHELVINFPSNLDSAISSIIQYNWQAASRNHVDKSKKFIEKPKKEQHKKHQKREKKVQFASVVDDDGFKIPSKSPKLTTSSIQPKKSINESSSADKPMESNNKKPEISTLVNVEKIPKERKERTVFLSNISFEVDEDILRKSFEECGEVVDVRLAKSRTNRSKGYGYLEFSTTEATKKALLLDRIRVSNRPLYVSPCIDKTKESLPFKYSIELSENILYINKLSKDTTLEKLKEAFGEIAEGIKEIRIVTNRSGASKGYAYMELTDSPMASKAILMYDGMIIDGATIGIAKSNPPKRKEISTNKSKQLDNPQQQSSVTHVSTKNNNWSRQKPRLMVSNVAKKQETSPSNQQVSNGKTNKTLNNNYFRGLFK